MASLTLKLEAVCGLLGQCVSESVSVCECACLRVCVCARVRGQGALRDHNRMNDGLICL